MSTLSDERKAQIIAALEKSGAKLPCPRCGNKTFSLIDGYFNQTLQFQLGGITLGGPSIPTVVVACNQCGFLSQHAIGVLGLLSNKEGGK